MGYPRSEQHDRSSGAVDFIIGAVLAAWGGYLVCERMIVTTHYRLSIYGRETGFFPVFSLFLLGVFFLAMGRSWLAKLFMLVGGCLTLWGAVNALDIHFQPASLMNTVIMFSMLVGGLGMVAKALLDSKSQN